MHSAPFVIHNGRFYCASNYSTGCHDVTSFCGCNRAIRAEAFRFSAILFARSMRRVYFTPTKSYALNNWCFYSVIPCPYSQGRIYVGAGARFTCCSQIQKLADHSDVISGVRKCSKIQIFRGFAPDPAGGAYSAPAGLLTDGNGAFLLPLPRTPPPLSALRASFLRVSGSNPLQSWQPY